MKKIAVIGLGYAGLPLARLFATKYAVVGYDISRDRISALSQGKDSTCEVSAKALSAVKLPENPFKTKKAGLFLSTNPEDISAAEFFIITVPTPVDKNYKPDLTPLFKASETVGKFLKKGDTVIYESTVYPGVTEEECVPVLEKTSGLKFNQDFFAGYSPERINPGDKERTVEHILKVTSGSTPDAAKKVDELYNSVISAGTHLAPSIKVAEAAKVIENSQRDINIAFVNELAKIFNLMDIDTREVLEAAGTKWNFMPFTPGLVGGHCIVVDPYYLVEKAQNLGYQPEIILAGRNVNNSMGSYVASQVVKQMLKNDLAIKNSKILVLGFTFKENCPDVRNTKVIDVVKHLEDYGAEIIVSDPWANPGEVQKEYGITTTEAIPEEKFHAIILAVPHTQFLDLDLSRYLQESGVIYDVKGVLPGENVVRL